MTPIPAGTRCHATARGWKVAGHLPGLRPWAGEPVFDGDRPAEKGTVVGFTPGGLGLAAVETDAGRLVFRMGFEVVAHTDVHLPP